MQTPPSMDDFAAEFKQSARRLGFVLSGVCAAATPPHFDAFLQWLDRGCAGTMQYLPQRRDAYRHPDSVLEGCRTVVMLAVPYDPQAVSGGDEEDCPARGKVARYARGPRDYHDVIHERLKRLRQTVLDVFPQARVRGVVDTAPLLEREFAQQAGLGWIGKNTMLLNKHWGSYFFLAALLTDLELPIDAPHSSSHCGTCRACLDACPTAAFPQPHLLDARRCISYLTIEHRQHVDANLRSQLAGWVFGCDVCQEVCPWNRKAPDGDPEFRAVLGELDLLELLEIDDAGFRSRFRRTPLWRAKRRNLVRNAILVLATRAIRSASPALVRLLEDTEPVIRGAAVWGLGRLQPAGWRELLRKRLEIETDAEVRTSIQTALQSPQEGTA
ncbi:MAG: tRNA epoxyqueuosine(34) reductase QueG [Planctomycetota bacterium]|nr:MAG: tRNA epoxyqueuosine(34) reductase QueG [Planctomycetota bacterium]